MSFTTGAASANGTAEADTEVETNSSGTSTDLEIETQTGSDGAADITATAAASPETARGEFAADGMGENVIEGDLEANTDDGNVDVDSVSSVTSGCGVSP